MPITILPRKSFISFLKIFLLIFIPTLLVLLGVLLISYRQTLDKTEQVLKVTQLEQVNSLNNLLSNKVDSVVSDLLVLSSHAEVSPYITENNEADKANLQSEFVSMIEVKQIYDQIRYINNEGQELIRVNLERHNAVIIPNEELQDKSSRYYFKESINLPVNTIYISSFDLNVENERIEIPEKPMIRFAKPVADSTGKIQGIVVINYLGQDLIDLFETSTKTEQTQMSFVNQDGYWMKGPNPYETWGFMYESKQDITFGNKYKEEWAKINETISGQFDSVSGLFTFITVYPLQTYKRVDSKYDIYSSTEDLSWKVISFIPKKQIDDQILDNLQSPMIISIFLLLILTMVTLFLAKAIWNRQQVEKKVHNLNDLLRLLNKTIRHDILNNLTSIKYSLELYQDVKENTYLTEIEAATEKSISFIHEMKKLEVEGVGKDLEEFEISTLMKKISKNFKKLRTSVTGKAFIKADKAIKSAIENIIRNSIQHGKATELEIRILKKDRYIEVRVADNGKGVPEKLLGKLFEEGFKHGESGNTGMGLYIVRQIMRRYGGEVYAEPNEPKGLVIVLKFPTELET